MSDAEKKLIASVILDDAVSIPFDYSVPPDLRSLAKVGSRIVVPVKNTLRKATIWDLRKELATRVLKDVKEILVERPVLKEDLIQLASWMSHYYCTPLHKVLKFILPPSIREDKQTQAQLFVKKEESLEDLANYCNSIRASHPLQAQVLDCILASPKGMFLSELMEKAGVSRSPIDTLVKKKKISLEKMQIDKSPIWEHDFFLTKNKVLNKEQEKALQSIVSSLEKNTFCTHLLHGITGSGKTEVYLQAIEHTLQMQKTVIFLVPEIILTSQTIERIRSRFKEKIALLHHRLSHGERLYGWHDIEQGKAPIVIGARSAIFSPVPNLGLIIVDEEHESSYKQQGESPCYHGRDVAVMRGKITNAVVLLGSATPSLESYYNAKQGKYVLSELSTRPDSATLPSVHVVDMKVEYLKQKGFALFSDKLISSLKGRISKGEQSILLLNRRGYHTSQLCLHCSHVMSCPHCETKLTFHLGESLLACHLCDYRIPPPRVCPNCHKEGHLKYKGCGTEMVEKALYALFPEVRILRMDADTTRHKGSHEKLFKEFRSGKADVLIGTQMIAKGLHFPAVTLVGVLHADTSLQIPDFRSSETSFQMITQVAGRAGRGEIPGEVIIQTLLPDNPIIQKAAKQDYFSFYEEEISQRELFTYPPFIRMVKITLSGESKDLTEQKAVSLRELLIKQLPPASEILPVIPCGHAKIQGKYRFQLLIKTDKIATISARLAAIVPYQDKKIQISIDVDPLSTFF